MAELSRLLGTTGHPSFEAGDDAVAQGGLAVYMVKDLLDERIVIETAASDGIEILITAGLVAIGAETGHAGQGELLAGVIVDQLVQRDYCILPLLHNLGRLASGNLRKVYLPVTLDGIIRPSPLVTVIVIENFEETIRKDIDISNHTGYHIITNPLNLRSRCYQA